MTAWTFGHCRELDGHHPTFGSMLYWTMLQWTDTIRHWTSSHTGRTFSHNGLRTTLKDLIGHFTDVYTLDGYHPVFGSRLRWMETIRHWTSSHTGWMLVHNGLRVTLDGSHPTLDFNVHFIDVYTLDGHHPTGAFVVHLYERLDRVLHMLQCTDV